VNDSFPSAAAAAAAASEQGYIAWALPPPSYFPKSTQRNQKF